MTFKCSLFKAIDRSDVVVIDDYAVETFFYVPKTENTKELYSLTLPDGNDTEVVVFDQEIEVDEFGIAFVTNSAYDVCQFEFRRARPLDERDVYPERR